MPFYKKQLRIALRNCGLARPHIDHYLDRQGYAALAKVLTQMSPQEVIDEIKKSNDPEKHVIVQTAPSIRSTIGEEFGYPVGTLLTGQMVAALRRLGFDRVFDDCFAVDVTVMEEGTELLERLEKGGPFPQFTACCPSWVKFCESFYPDLIGNLSECKSPQQIFGALAKTYYAKKEGIDPEKIFCVSIMPCVSKKYELRGRKWKIAASAMLMRNLARGSLPRCFSRPE